MNLPIQNGLSAHGAQLVLDPDAVLRGFSLSWIALKSSIACNTKPFEDLRHLWTLHNLFQLVPTVIETVLQYVSICHNRILIFTWETPAALPGEGIEQHVHPTSIATKPPSDILSPRITLDRARHKLVVTKLREVCAVVCCTTHWKAINRSIGKELHEILREKCQSWRNRVSKVQTLTDAYAAYHVIWQPCWTCQKGGGWQNGRNMFFMQCIYNFYAFSRINFIYSNLPNAKRALH